VADFGWWVNDINAFDDTVLTNAVVVFFFRCLGAVARQPPCRPRPLGTPLNSSILNNSIFYFRITFFLWALTICMYNKRCLVIQFQTLLVVYEYCFIATWCNTLIRLVLLGLIQFLHSLGWILCSFIVHVQGTRDILCWTRGKMVSGYST